MLPSPIAVLDLDGCVEVSTECAERFFRLKPGVHVVTMVFAQLAHSFGLNDVSDSLEHHRCASLQKYYAGPARSPSPLLNWIDVALILSIIFLFFQVS